MSAQRSRNKNGGEAIKQTEADMPAVGNETKGYHSWNRTTAIRTTITSARLIQKRLEQKSDQC